MTDKTITYNEFDEHLPKDGRGPGERFGHPVDLGRWPTKVQKDGIEWGLGWTAVKTPVMADNGTHPDNLAVVEDGDDELDGKTGIDWVLRDPEREHLPERLRSEVEERRGTYFDMSKYAVHYNKVQERGGLTRVFTFYPTMLTPTGAR